MTFCASRRTESGPGPPRVPRHRIFSICHVPHWISPACRRYGLPHSASAPPRNSPTPCAPPSSQPRSHLIDAVVPSPLGSHRWPSSDPWGDTRSRGRGGTAPGRVEGFPHQRGSSPLRSSWRADLARTPAGPVPASSSGGPVSGGQVGRADRACRMPRGVPRAGSGHRTRPRTATATRRANGEGRDTTTVAGSRTRRPLSY